LPRAFPVALARIDSRRRGQLRPRRHSTPLAGTPPAGSVPRRPCQTAGTTYLPPLPVQEPPTCARSRPTVRPIAIASGSLRLVEPAALSPVGLRSVGSCRIHLPGTLRSPGVTRLRRYYGPSDSCAAGASPVWSTQVSLCRVQGRPTIPPPT